MASRTGRIPLWVKLAYTAFVAVLVPYYWRAYGPTNFLYFCDVALLMALVALWTWTVLTWVLLPICYFLLPAPPPLEASPNTPVNINYVYGFDDRQAQTWMPPLAWLTLLMVALPLAVFLPTHLILKRVYRQPSRRLDEGAGAAGATPRL